MEYKDIGRFDFCIAVHVIEHCPNPQLAIDNIGKLLNLYGILYVEVPIQNKEKVPTRFGHYFCFSNFDELDRLFDNRWKFICNEPDPKYNCIRNFYIKI